MLAKLTRHGQITLPKAVRDRLQLREGDSVEVEIVEGARGILLRPKRHLPVDPDQAWFWQDAWQLAEQEADQDIAAERVIRGHADERASEILKRAAAAWAEP